MKILVIDTDLAGLAFCKKCSEAGHQVRWYVKKKPANNPKVGLGFKVQPIENWVSSINWADVVFITHNDEFLKRLDFFKGKGVPVFAPSVESADLEIKRGEGMKFLEKHGIEVPAFKTFKNLKEAEDHVWKTEERYVFKTLGDNEDKSLSYVAKSPADLIARLQRWQEIGMNPKGEVMLQTFIEGIEMGVSRWMGKDGYIGMWNENFEHKKLMPGDKGCNTGEMGTVMKYTQDSLLGDVILDPIEDALIEMGHLGDVDVNCIIDDKGKAWPLEFTCRPGWPAFNIMMATHKGDPVNWMLDACKGKDTLEATEDVAVGILLGIPPFPHPAEIEECEGLPIYGVTKQNQKYLYPMEVMIQTMPDMQGDKIVENEVWTTAGEYVAVVTGTGKNIEQASERAYKTVSELHVSDMIYRNDIGKKLEETLPKIQKMGYAESFQFGGDKR